ncbi:MAG: hypothetical protein ACYC3L_13410 [Gemmatimonadaceae bacterium]
MPQAAPPEATDTLSSADDDQWSAEPDTARWWERRRLLYNALLTVVFVALVARTWSRIRPELNASAIAPLLFLAGLANALYTAAYIADLPLQAFAPPARDRARWAVWTAGTLLAVLLETCWYLDEILPPAS